MPCRAVVTRSRVLIAAVFCAVASVAAAQSFDCSGGAIVVPPGDYGAITIDTGATACGSVTIADVVANNITIYASGGGGINVAGAIAITRLTCKPAARVCVDFQSTTVTADSITLRSATYDSTIVASETVNAIVLRIQGAVSSVRSIEVADVDMRVEATSTGGVVQSFLVQFSSMVTGVGALAWRNTTLAATLSASSTVVATAWFSGADVGRCVAARRRNVPDWCRGGLHDDVQLYGHRRRRADVAQHDAQR
jgi:hypothetical protein